jgi:hypothetical protein
VSEGGEVGQHYFAHLHRVHDGLKEDALIFQLRADEDEEAGGGQDRIVQEESDEDGAQRKQLAKAG